MRRRAWPVRLARRIAYWFRLRSNHDDLINELAYHREMAERDLIAAGDTETLLTEIEGHILRLRKRASAKGRKRIGS